MSPDRISRFSDRECRAGRRPLRPRTAGPARAPRPGAARRRRRPPGPRRARARRPPGSCCAVRPRARPVPDRQRDPGQLHVGLLLGDLEALALRLGQVAGQEDPYGLVACRRAWCRRRVRTRQSSALTCASSYSSRWAACSGFSPGTSSSPAGISHSFWRTGWRYWRSTRTRPCVVQREDRHRAGVDLVVALVRPSRRASPRRRCAPRSCCRVNGVALATTCQSSAVSLMAMTASSHSARHTSGNRGTGPRKGPYPGSTVSPRTTLKTWRPPACRR